MPMPAAITVNGPTQPPAAGASAARARPGNARTNKAPSISERRTTVLLCTCGVLVMAGIVMRSRVAVVTFLRVLDGSRDAQHRQHHEDEGLKEGDQHLQRIEKAHGEHDGDDAAEAADDRSPRASMHSPPEQALPPHQ